MGFEAARQFLALNASHIILAVRSRAKGQGAASVLKDAYPDATIQVFELDLDDYQSGLQFAQRVKREVKELDILLNNGGVNIMKYQKSKSGHERVMQGVNSAEPCIGKVVMLTATVNCYTHVLISLELLPLLRATSITRGAPTHLTFVGSATQTSHTLVKKPVTATGTVLDHFDDESIYQGLTRYADSKLVVNAFIRRLAAVVPPSEVIINSPCPGLVATGFDKHLPGWLKPLMFIYRKISARDVSEGTRTLVYACAVAGPETHGKFLQHNHVHP